MEKIKYQAKINKVVFLPYLVILFFFTMTIRAYFMDIDYYMYNYSQESISLTVLFFLLMIIYSCIGLIKTFIAIVTTKLYFTNKIFVGKKGFIKTISLDTPLNKINDIMITQNLGGKILNYATVNILTSSSKYDFKYIKDAELFKKKLKEEITLKDSLQNEKNNDRYDKLKKLKELLDDNVISKDEFNKEKEKILNKE